jgi:integrase
MNRRDEPAMIQHEEPKATKRPARRRRRGGLGLYQTRPGRWKLDCWIRGQRLRRSFGAINEKLARELAMAARAAALRGPAGILPAMRRDSTFDRALREFRERHLPGLRATTQRAYTQQLDRLEAFFVGKRLSEIGPLTVEGYRKARTQNHTRSKVRCNREVALLRTLYARMAAWNLYDGDNPVRTLGGKPTVGAYEESRGRERVLTPAEEARLMGELDAPYDTLVLLGLHTGVRLRSEGLKLTWQDVNLERARLTVQGAHAKNKTPRVIPLSAPPVAALARLRGDDAAPTAPVFVTRAGRPLRDLRSVLWRAARRAKRSIRRSPSCGGAWKTSRSSIRRPSVSTIPAYRVPSRTSATSSSRSTGQSPRNTAGSEAPMSGICRGTWTRPLPNCRRCSRPVGARPSRPSRTSSAVSERPGPTLRGRDRPSPNRLRGP